MNEPIQADIELTAALDFFDRLVDNSEDTINTEEIMSKSLIQIWDLDVRLATKGIEESYILLPYPGRSMGDDTTCFSDGVIPGWLFYDELNDSWYQLTRKITEENEVHVWDFRVIDFDCTKIAKNNIAACRLLESWDIADSPGVAILHCEAREGFGMSATIQNLDREGLGKFSAVLKDLSSIERVEFLF